METALTEAASGWRGCLELGFERRAAGTRLVHRRHVGPLLVQRTFHPEPGVCHAYLLHPPGGVVGGDRLELRTTVGEGAHALLTAPAAGKFYRSAGLPAGQEVYLSLEPGAVLEWLPQESIFFEGARVETLTRVDLPAEATFLGWEINCLGRPAAGEGFDHGALRQRFELWREGRPLYLERGRFEGGGAVLTAAWGLRNQPVFATFIASGNRPGLDGVVREAVSAEGALFSVSQLESVLVCRYLGSSAEQARRCFEHAWSILRPTLLERPACPPRVWNT